MFQGFVALRHRKDSHTMFIDGPVPLSDIFYLLQILAPGLLRIIREEDIDDVGEEQTARILPPHQWVQDNKEILEHVIGSKEGYESIAAAAGDTSKSFKSEWISNWRDNYYDEDNFYTNIWGQREIKDFTACDKECGYCGRCDY